MMTKTKMNDIDLLNKRIRNGIKDLIRDYQEEFGINFDFAKADADDVKCDDPDRYRYLTGSHFYYIQTGDAKCIKEYEDTYASLAHRYSIRTTN